MRRGVELWGTATISASVLPYHGGGDMSTAAAQTQITARRAQREYAEEEARPFAGTTAPKARVY